MQYGPGRTPYTSTVNSGYDHTTPLDSLCVCARARHLYCTVSRNLYSASDAHQSEALPVRETREKKEVLRQRKKAHGPPVNKEERVEGWSWFHSAGPMKAKAVRACCGISS